MFGALEPVAHILTLIFFLMDIFPSVAVYGFAKLIVFSPDLNIVLVFSCRNTELFSVFTPGDGKDFKASADNTMY